MCAPRPGYPQSTYIRKVNMDKFRCPDHSGLVLPAILKTGVFKDLLAEQPEVCIENQHSHGNTCSFIVSSNVYAHAVHFNLPDDVKLSDEYFDLLPGEKREIRLYNLPEPFDVERLKAYTIV